MAKSQAWDIPIDLREVRSNGLGSQRSQDPQDNVALSRTGKKPVLKVY